MTIDNISAATDRIVRAESVLCAEIDGEVVALDIEKGVCYGLDAIGSHVWAIIEKPTSVAEICRMMTARYKVDPETCARDVTALIADLRDEGLVQVRPAHSPAPVEA